VTWLAPPHLGLRACVVVPARDEEERIGACIAALAAQVNVDPRSWETLLVLDACTDSTAARAAEAASVRPHLRLETIEGPGAGPGPARRLGMDAACARLHAVGRPDGLIASTDADTVVAPDWLAAQIDAAARGARAIGGRIELSAPELALLPPGVAHRRAAQARRRHAPLLAAERAGGGTVEHWQFSGASLALTAATYAEVGGLGEHTDLEDEALERALRRHGVPIERTLAVRVTTSARVTGRAARGLARDLARAAELERSEPPAHTATVEHP
jgi:glucosyl-3-phosphoglycerate synthase